MNEYVIPAEFVASVHRTVDRNPFAILNTLICNELYNEIIKGHLLPDHKIIESKLAASLGVSRSPVKMALQELESRGILVKGRGNSLHVKEITYDECYWVWEVRMTIEPVAAYAAAKRIRDDELAQLESLLCKFDQGNAHRHEKSYTDADKLFHELVIQFSKNPYYVQMYKVIEFPLACYRHQLNQLHHEDFFIKRGLEATVDHHRSIYEMLKSHYPIMAQDAMRNDVQRMYGTMSRLDW